jgi:hypothetical protein
MLTKVARLGGKNCSPKPGVHGSEVAGAEAKSTGSAVGRTQVDDGDDDGDVVDIDN